MREANPWTVPKSRDRVVIPKGDLETVHGKVVEDNEVSKRRNQKEI